MDISNDNGKPIIMAYICTLFYRSWLSAGVSTHEKFLLQFPCINAFVAQLLLTVAPLKSIVGQDAAELKEKYPWIPPRVIHVKLSARNILTEFTTQQARIILSNIFRIFAAF